MPDPAPPTLIARRGPLARRVILAVLLLALPAILLLYLCIGGTRATTLSPVTVLRWVSHQIDATLLRIGSDRSRLLMVQIYLADLADAPVLNALWDAWTPDGHAPVRMCVQAGLSGTYRVEMVITAASGTQADE